MKRLFIAIFVMCMSINAMDPDTCPANHSEPSLNAKLTLFSGYAGMSYGFYKSYQEGKIPNKEMIGISAIVATGLVTLGVDIVKTIIAPK